MAKSGGIVWLDEAIFRISNEKINAKAITIPMAKLSPIPPLFFTEEIDKARILKIKIETGIEVL